MGQALAVGLLRDRVRIKRGALHEVIQGFVRRGLGRQEEVPAGRGDRFRNRLAGEQVVAEVDGPQVRQALCVDGQPALGGVAFAVLFLRAILGRDKLRHQRHRHGVAGSHHRAGQHGMVVLRYYVAVATGETGLVLGS